MKYDEVTELADARAYERECVYNAVAEALSNALENGHDFKGWTDDQIVDDMMSYSANVEDMPRGLVAAAVHDLRS